MRAQLRKAWESRAPRERTIIAVLAIVLGVVLYVWLVQAAGQARMQLSASVMTLRAQAARLDQQAPEYARLRTAQPATASPKDLRSMVQNGIGEAGLALALVSMDSPDASQIKVVFGAVPFADWLAWAASLQAQHVRLDASRIEALSKPGLVSVTATFTRSEQ